MSQKNLEFHVKSQDYFGTLATVLSFTRQTLNSKKFNITNIRNLEEIEEDLMYLQKKYLIVKNKIND